MLCSFFRCSAVASLLIIFILLQRFQQLARIGIQKRMFIAKEPTDEIPQWMIDYLEWAIMALKAYIAVLIAILTLSYLFPRLRVG